MRRISLVVIARLISAFEARFNPGPPHAFAYYRTMALGKYGPTTFSFRPADVEVYDLHGNRVTTYSDSTGATPAPPSISSRGQVYFWVEAGTYDLMLSTAGDSGTVTQSIIVAPGGVDEPNPNAASSWGVSLSSSKVAQINAVAGGTVALGASRVVTFAGATILTGDAVWGAGTALPLDLTVVGTQFQLPDDDAGYDLSIDVSLTCDVADDDKMVAFSLTGAVFNFAVQAPVTGGFVRIQTAFLDYIPLGFGPSLYTLRVDPQSLTVAPVINYATVIVVKRA